mgnify:FL=1
METNFDVHLCDSCKGDGTMSIMGPSEIVPCDECGGTGRIEWSECVAAHEAGDPCECEREAATR